MNKFTIKSITQADFADWLAMCNQLHHGNSLEENEADLQGILKDDRYEVFIARDNNGHRAGYIELSTRSDYVEGSFTSPVGYIESIFVEEKYRREGLGSQLVEFAESWCRQKGFKELGSDTEMGNEISQEFHKAVGFTAEPIVTFIKKL